MGLYNITMVICILDNGDKTLSGVEGSFTLKMETITKVTL